MRFQVNCRSMLVVALLLAGCGRHESAPGVNGNIDPRLEGTYTLIKEETRGLVRKETEADMTYTFIDGKLLRGKNEVGAVTCDPNKTPAEITISKTEINGKVARMYGIYKLEGDTLTLCLVRSDNAGNRPKEFKTDPESSAILWILKKVP